MDKLAIIGAGHLGEQMAHYAKLVGYDVVGFFDDTLGKGELKYNIPVLGSINDIEASFNSNEFTHIIIGIGYKHLEFKSEVYSKIKTLNIPFGSIICDQTYVDRTVKLGDGIFIMPGCVVDQRVEIGDCAILNCNTTISHDSKVGNYCFFGPGVVVSGFVNIGERSFIGSGSTLIDSLTICSEVQVGAGAVVANNISDKGVYLGVPARKKL